MYPGMRSHLKPQCIDMGCPRRQATTTDKTKFKGLPHKHNLAVPMLKEERAAGAKWCWDLF